MFCGKSSLREVKKVRKIVVESVRSQLSVVSSPLSVAERLVGIPGCATFSIWRELRITGNGQRTTDHGQPTTDDGLRTERGRED